MKEGKLVELNRNRNSFISWINVIGKSNVFIIHYKRINLKGFEFFFIDVLLFHIITLVFFFQSDLGQIQFPEMGIFFFLIFYRGAKIPEQKKKKLKNIQCVNWNTMESRMS